MKSPNRGKYIVVALLLIISFFFGACKQNIEAPTSINENILITDKVISTLDSLIYTDLNIALSYATALINSDSIKSDSILYYNIISKMGIIKAYTGETDSSLFFFNTAMNYWKNDTSIVGNKNYSTLLYNIAYKYDDIGKKDTSIYLLKKALELAENTNLFKHTAQINLRLSEVYQSKGEYFNALECIEKCINFCQNSNDSTLMVPILLSLAELYSSCYLFDDAKAQFDQILNYQNYFTPYTRFSFYNGKGRMHYLNDNYNSAKSEFLNALEFAEKNDQVTYSLILLNLAETSLLLDQLDSAQYYLELINDQVEVINNFPLFGFNFNSLLGEFYCKTGKYSLAYHAYSISDSLGKMFDIDKVILKLHKKRKARYYVITNNFDDAYFEMREYNELERNISEEDNLKQLAGFKFKYQRDTTIISQRHNLIIKEQQIKTYKYQQWLYIISIVVLLLLVLFIVLFFRKVRALNHEKNIRKIAALKMENIRGRISPHFMFNVLNNIWAIINDKKTAKVKFDSLMKMIRHSLINTEKMSIPLSEEIEFVKSFIELQNLLLLNEIDVEWDIDKLIDQQQPVPGMILQIPVENAIKHGLSPKIGEKKLRIEMGLSYGFLNIIIRDNGIGYHPSSISTQGTGTGLKVLNNTLQLLNQVNTQKMSYNITNLNDNGITGTQVNIRIPLIYNYNLS